MAKKDPEHVHVAACYPHEVMCHIPAHTHTKACETKCPFHGLTHEHTKKCEGPNRDKPPTCGK